VRYTLGREFYIPKNGTPVTRKGLNGIVYTYSNDKGQPCAMAFRGKAHKPEWRFYFLKEEQRQVRIDQFFNSIKARADMMSARKESRKNGARLDVSVGDLFNTSWGYDQTNYDYLIVVAVSASGKTATCKMVNQINVGTSGQSDVITPGCAVGEPFKLQVREHSLVGSYPFIYDQPRSVRMGYFDKCRLGETHHQTNPVFGH